MRHPPGPRGREVLGFLGAGSTGGMLQFFESTAKCFGPISSFRILHKWIYLVDDPDPVQELLVTRQHDFMRETGATLVRELVGDGLLTREEPLHRERRRILQPAFHRDQISSYVAFVLRLVPFGLQPNQQYIDLYVHSKSLPLKISPSDQ